MVKVIRNRLEKAGQWEDDGVRDPHEPFAATNAAGGYVIGGLLPGPYKVMLDPLTIPAGTTVTGDPDVCAADIREHVGVVDAG
jgi:hypothetical protein